MIGTSITRRTRTPLRRPSARLQIYPQTRTPDAEADIAVLSRFCDFDPTDIRHAWTRMELTNVGLSLRRCGVDPATAGLRFHLLVEDARNTMLVTSGPDGRHMRLQEKPIFPMRESDTQRTRLDRLQAWNDRVLDAGFDPACAPAWAYEWDSLLVAMMIHHGISPQDLLDRLDRPRFLCGKDWPKARRPRGDQPRLRPIEEAPGLCFGGEFDAGRIVLTDLLLADDVAYRLRRKPQIVLTNKRLPRIAINGMTGLPLMGVVEHPLLRDPGMIIEAAHHAGKATILTVTPPAWRHAEGAPAGF